MARVGGSFESVVGGVSEQAPQDRRSGQVWEQLNMISDPVRGVVRREGSQHQGFMGIAGTNEISLLEDAAKSYVTTSYYCDGRELELGYSKEGRKHGLPNLFCYDKTLKQFLNIRGTGKIFDAISTHGVSSLVNIGRFLFIAANNYTPEWAFRQNKPAASAAKNGVVWVRNGNYSRKYVLTLKMANGVVVTVTHNTPSSSYPGGLDTTDIPVPTLSGNTTEDLNRFNGEMAKYNKAITDRTNQYNSSVTQWLGTSTTAIQPDQIATALVALIKPVVTANGGNPANVNTVGSYVAFDANAKIANVSIVDGGDDTYLRGVVDTVDSPDKLSPNHYNGHIVHVAPRKSTAKDGYYLRATTKNDEGFGEVTWRESTGEITTPTGVFCTAWADATTLYIGSTPTELNTMAPAAECPLFKPSTVGDSVSTPLPQFFGKQITYLGVFQDRLLIAHGAVVFASRPGDYFNWFRQSVLTVEDNDPVEMYALGSEDDTIYWDATFDRNHILFGKKYQYVLPGRSMLTPRTPSIQILSANEDAINAEPKTSGNFVFFAKDSTTKGSLHQIQMGATSDSSESYECSQQLDKYIKGKPVQLLAMTAPYNIVIRSDRKPNGIYIYAYLDAMTGSERLFDSWARWEWDRKLGPSVGVSKWKGDLLNFSFRPGPNGTPLVVCDKFTFETDISERPYLDSLVPLDAKVKGNVPWWSVDWESVCDVAYDNTHKYFMLGSNYSKIDRNIPDWEADVNSLWLGVPYEAYVIPTNPYIRDRNDKAIINGRLTLSHLEVAVTDTGGIVGYVESTDRSIKMKMFDGRILTRTQNKVGRAPLVTTTIKVPVFKEIREANVCLVAHNWLPLSITGIEWLGQWFSNVRRV